MIQTIFFISISLTVFYFAIKKFLSVYQYIHLGRPEEITGSGRERWKNMLLFALGQKKMFSRPIAGILHLFIYLAFILTQLELIETIIDGILGHHRILQPLLGQFYTFIINTIEFLSLLALVATFVFLYRRNVIKLLRFQKPEMKGWPSLDANLILFGEITLVIGIFMMNGADQSLQNLNYTNYHETGRFFLSSFLSGHLFNTISGNWLFIIERFGWWLHYLTVLGFVLYLPYSKHLHIFLAFPNSYYSNLTPRGQMKNIPVIENEVRNMLGLTEKTVTQTSDENFGAKDIFDLSWRTIMEAYSCTECGRCTAVCPANLTGKALSPRKIMMDIRDRTEEVGTKWSQSGKPDIKTYDDGKSLFDYITKEEIYACTTCNACVEACPVLINPLDPILQLRRSDILMNSGGPADWLPMFNSLENSQSVWAVSGNRTEWVD